MFHVIMNVLANLKEKEEYLSLVYRIMSDE